jgi:hypothetical protein
MVEPAGAPFYPFDVVVSGINRSSRGGEALGGEHEQRAVSLAYR